MTTDRNKNLFGQSRWRIILLLRKQSLGVKELSEELGVTDNAIRPHLAVLERDGLVKQIGVKQSGGQPAHIFELTEDAELLFPKAYGVLLSHLLAQIRESGDPRSFKKLLKDTAQRLAGNWPAATGDTVQRLEVGVQILNDIGGLSEIEEISGGHAIQGYSCPIATVSKDQPDVCYLAEELLRHLTGLNFVRACHYGDKPKCRFELKESA